MKRMVSSLFLFFFVAVGALCARPVSPDEARCAAMAWAARNRIFAGSQGSAGAAVAVEDGAGQVLCYKVPFADGPLVITSAETRVNPIIAVVPRCPEGADIPEGHPLKAMLETDMAERLERVAAPGAPVPLGESAEERRWSELTGQAQTGGPVVLAEADTARSVGTVYTWPSAWAKDRLTHWNQNNWNNYGTWTSGEIYDKYTPNHYPAGCVAVCGAALLQHRGVGSVSKSVTCSYWVDGVKRTESLALSPYVWSVMPTRWSSETVPSEAAKDLAGRVLRDVGYLIGMKYTKSGSGASIADLTTVLRDVYGFASAVYAWDVGVDQYEKLIYSQLRCEKPVMLSIQGESGGHAVLAVGYGEDDGGMPLIRIFMGWGGRYDAWYALPNVGDYTALSGVGTLISPDTRRYPLYGRVTDSTGKPLSWGEITVSRYGGWLTRLGADGEFGLMVPAGDYEVSVRVGDTVKTVNVGDYTMPSNSSYRAEELASRLPGPLNITVSGDAGLQVYTDAETARAEALRQGKPLFVLSGADWCGYCSTVKAYLRDQGRAFTDDFVLYYCNIDADDSGMAGSSPQYGVFDPRTFVPSRGWYGNTALAEDSGGLESRVEQVLTQARAAWKKPTLSTTALVGPSILFGATGYRLQATFTDGVTTTVGVGADWSMTGSTSAFSLAQDGTLTPVGTSGSVTLKASMTLFGRTVSQSKTVRAGQTSEIRSLSLAHLRSPLDLETDSDYVFTCQALLTNGESVEVPATWTVSKGTMDAAGHLTLDEAGTSFSVTVTASAYGKSASRVITVYPPAWCFPMQLTLSESAAYPGSVVRISSMTIRITTGGKAKDTTDLSGVNHWIQIQTSDGRILRNVWSDSFSVPKDLYGLTSGETVKVQWMVRLDRQPIYWWTAGSIKSLTLRPVGTTAGAACGNVPLGWIQAHFPQATTEATQRAYALLDSDGDGLLNWEEYVAGTDPNDPKSTFAITAFEVQPGQLPKIDWTESPGRTYTLQGKTALEGVWEENPSADARFFRVLVEPSE